MSRRSPTLQRFLSRFILQPPRAESLSLPRRQAAVLVPIISRPSPTLLLTRRSATLRKHAGQVAFPGGMRDASDDSLVTTALREAEEEVAIPPQAVNVIGVLPPLSAVPVSRSRQWWALLRRAFAGDQMPERLNPCSKCRWRKHFVWGVMRHWIFSVPGIITESGFPGSMTTLSGE